MSDLETKHELTGNERGILRRPGQKPVIWSPKPVIEQTIRGLAGEFKGETGQKGDKGDKGDPGKDGAPGPQGATGPQGAAGSPKRVERYQGTVSGSQGIATVTFPAFSKAPLGKVIDGWNGDQQITGMVTAVTTTTATVAVKRCRGSLLLSAGPYETAPAGSVVMIELIGD